MNLKTRLLTEMAFSTLYFGDPVVDYFNTKTNTIKERLGQRAKGRNSFARKLQAKALWAIRKNRNGPGVLDRSNYEVAKRFVADKKRVKRAIPHVAAAINNVNQGVAKARDAAREFRSETLYGFPGLPKEVYNPVHPNDSSVDIVNKQLKRLPYMRR